MKIKSLELEAFGPYLERQYIDFTPLNEAELFLVTGDTGAGKTTIFDAICFALYGVASGDSRQVNQFRHQKADAQQETYVKLTFEIHHHEYVITRYPNYYREGYKTEARHRAYLEGAGEHVIEGVNEVAAKIKEIIGVDANEFRQVAMIAQGQFSRLIQASSKERETILRELFDTHAYAYFQDRLKKAERDLKEVYQAEKLRLDTYLEALGEIEEEPLSYLQGQMDTISETLNQQVQQSQQYEQQSQALNQDLLQARNLWHWQDQLIALEKKNNRLEENASKMMDLQEEIELLDKVKGIVLDEKQYLQAQEAYDEIHQKYQHALSQKATLEQQYATLQAQSEEMMTKEKLLMQIEQQIGEIDEDLNKVERYVKAKNLLNQANQQERLLQEKKTLSLQQKNELETIIQRCLNDLKQFNDLEANQLSLAHESNRLNILSQKLDGLVKTKTHIENLQQTLQGQQKDWEIATGKQQKLSEAYLQLEKQYQANMAGILAEQLTEEMPCPVCGSTHHPKLATYANEDVHPAMLQEKQEALAQARQTVQDCFGTMMGTKQVLDLEKSHFQEALEKQSLETMQATYQNDYRRFEERKQAQMQAFERQKQLQKYLEDYQKRYDGWQSKHQELENKCQLAHENVVRRQEQFDYLATSFNEAFESLDLLVKRKTQLEKQKRELRKQLDKYHQDFEQYSALAMQNQGELRALNHEDQKALNQKNKTGDHFQEALDRALISSERYHEKKAGLVSLEEKRLLYQDYQQEKKIVETQIKEAKQQLQDQSLPDLEALTQSYQKVLDLQEAVKLAIERNKWQLESLTKQYQEISQSLKAYRQKEAKYQEIYEISRLVSGQNPSRMTFESYILTAYFEAILQRANLRLTAMSNGRYALLRKDEQQKGRALQGLDLNVMDYESGQPRDIRTLSGGEGFKAALSLALGMADLISESAGGIELDTLFIDEGFGSLDDRSLEMAIDALVELKQEHKVVGIISHVAALKERLTTKITVTHQKNSSVAKIS